ncbi:HypC/HybG/HupF family hydrogenase formation chaperone [Candidatus Woesearchaeota archaeon]|nr:HypC/HybG/HupF family hydrogenase formation chaperone [Candidatus Woesearchaeota archaeon]
MCLAIPGKIVKIDKDTAVIDYSGEIRKASVSLIDDLSVGDYVLVNAGFVMEKIPEEQALQSIKAWKNVGRKNE